MSGPNSVAGLRLTISEMACSIAGLSDPFQATVITNAVQLAVILIVVAAVDKLGRRNICCAGLTILWFSNVAVGILGLVETNKATSSLLVTFSCIWGTHNTLRLTCGETNQLILLEA